MDNTQKIAHVLSELKRVTLPPATDPEYWGAVEVRCENAVDTVCDTDKFIKNLIQFIETQ